MTSVHRGAALPPGASGATLPQDLPVFRRPVTPTSLLSTWAGSLGCQLLVNGEVEAAPVIFSEWVFLPLIAAAADTRAHLLLGLPKSCVLIKDERALFGVRVQMGPVTADGAGAARAAILVDAAVQVMGLRPGAQIECADLIDVYSDGALLRAAMRGG